ncbi:MAG: Thioredoxin-dependent 5-adenylylsulfate reductase [Bacteroidota bacterium]|jgi:phosphoadenosine phosphosulfate reductase
MSVVLASELSAKYAQWGISDTLTDLVRNFGDRIAFSSSFGQEDQVITHEIFANNIPIRVFTLDTGRLFQETYDVFASTSDKYGKRIEVYFPEAKSVEAMVQAKGPNSFYFSVENRKECCNIRKIEPLERALQGASIWITGLRGSQSANRSSMALFEWDERFKLVKYNPLIRWSLEEVVQYLEAYNVPQNALHKKGFVSIGCAPCTIATPDTDDIRAGRWWWEQSHKECGLHS